MASKIVFDSSALIMLFAKEPGYEYVRQNLKYAMISSVNIAEVYKYCIEVQNLSEDDCRNLIALCGIKIIDFCEEQALTSAKIINYTKQYGLSLGDRGCIALATLKNCPILTCDTSWQKINLNIQFIMAR
jgi:PIN domain nuclease of toxin-antitoxin system